MLILHLDTEGMICILMKHSLENMAHLKSVFSYYCAENI